MKKLFLAVALFLGLGFGSFAQNRSIAFEETKVWKEIVEKAKTEKKLIFVDCYTDWCPPCKDLTANVFTKDKVADFFNKNFINAKFEMENDADATVVNSLFRIKAYPTLLFVDPVTEKAVHRLVGSGTAEWLIENGKLAMDPGNNLNTKLERFKSGDHNPESVDQLLTALGEAYMHEEKLEVATDYLGTFSLDQLATDKNWHLLKSNIIDPTSKPFREVMANRQKFYEIAGQKDVDTYLAQSIVEAAGKLACWDSKSKFDTECAELTQYLQSIDFPEMAPAALVYLETGKLVHKEDWKGVIKKIKEMENSDAFQNLQYDYYHNFFIVQLTYSKDKNLILEGVKMVDKKLAKIGEGDNYLKADFCYTKHFLYASIGDNAAADKALAEGDGYFDKGDN